MANKILLGGHEEQVLVEVKAGAAITPGDLLKYSVAGNPPTAIRHATAGGNAEPMFALDSPEQNLGINDNYATNDRLQAVIAREGTLINARVAAAAAAIAFNDLLESAGDGTVRKHTPLTQPDEDGVYQDGNLAISATAEKFKTTRTTYWKRNGIQFSKAATDNLVFASAYTINTGAAVGFHWGIFLVQVDDAGTVTTKAPSADQVYTSSAAAIAALPAVDAGNTALGYILVKAKTGVDWVAITDDLTDGSDCETATFVDANSIAFTPTATQQEAIVGRAMEAVDNSGGGTAVRIKLEVAA